MGDKTTAITGGCLCGAVRFRVTAKPVAAYYCHCTMCQRDGGGPFMAGATVPIEAFAFTKGEPRAYESSPGFVRLSCGECGSSLGFQAKNSPKWADFTPGVPGRPERHQTGVPCVHVNPGELVRDGRRPAAPRRGRAGAGENLGRAGRLTAGRLAAARRSIR